MRGVMRLAALPVVIWSGMAVAQADPATQSGADALIAVFQTYLGSTPGVVTVYPDGAAYAVKLDLAPLAHKAPDLTASISPLELRLTDYGDGTWAVAQSQTFRMQVQVAGQLDLSLDIGTLEMAGIFDTGLQSFTTTQGSLSDLSMTETVVDPAFGDTFVSYQIASAQYESSAVAGAAGGVDLTSTYALSGLAEVFTLPAFAEGAPQTEVTLRAETYTAEGSLSGLRPDALLKLLAFFVANPSEAAIIAQQDGLRAILSDGLPLFETLRSTGTISAITADTPVGQITLQEAGIDIEANGLTENGLFSEGFRLKGLALPDGLVPAWAAGLVPTEATLGFSLTDFNLAAPAALLLSAVDFGAEIPADQQAALMAALLPEGAVTLALSPSRADAPLYGLTFEGAFAIAPQAMPVGVANVTVSGLPDVLTALQEAPPDVAMQIVPVLSMAQAMAQPAANGALSWEIEMTPEGAQLVNGSDLMGGGP